MHKHLRFYSTQAFSVLTLHLPKKLQTPPSRGPDLFTSEWPLLLHSPLPAPHSSLLLVLVQSGCPRPAADTAGWPRLSLITCSGRKKAAAGARLSAGPRASCLNRCPCHTESSPQALVEAAAGTPPAGQRGLRTLSPGPWSAKGPRSPGKTPRRALTPLFPRSP